MIQYTFLAFLGLFEFGSLFCGMAPSSNLFILARAVAGLGASGLLNGALSIIAAIAPMHKRPGRLGLTPLLNMTMKLSIETALIGFMMLSTSPQNQAQTMIYLRD